MTTLPSGPEDQKAPIRRSGRGLLRFGAGNETRTRDLDPGKVVLYQLSYSRMDGARNCRCERGEVKVKHDSIRRKIQHKQRLQVNMRP